MFLCGFGISLHCLYVLTSGLSFEMSYSASVYEAFVCYFITNLLHC